MGEEDLSEVWARIDQAAADGRTINVYVEFGAVPDVTLKVISDKFRRFRSLYKCIGKIAIVGDQRWLTLYESIAAPLKFDVRCFGADEKEEARSWIASTET